MKQNILLVIATGVGIAAGSGVTFVLMPQPDPQPRAPSHEEFVAAIEAGPSLLPRDLVARALETPKRRKGLGGIPSSLFPLVRGNLADLTISI